MTRPDEPSHTVRLGPKLPPGYSLQAAIPAEAEYLRLRRISGLTPRSAAAAKVGLPNSLYAVCIRHDELAVGMGRVIGDGALFLHIVDIAIDPQHQGLGLGKAVVAALLTYIERTVPAEAYVSLIANGDAFDLYERFGFSPVMPEARGMALWLGRPA